MLLSQTLKKEACSINNCGLYACIYSDSYRAEIADTGLFFNHLGYNQVNNICSRDFNP